MESQEVLEKYVALWKDISSKESIFASMRYLSHINKLRRGINCNGFERCGFVFLTATGRTLRLSSSVDFHKEGEVPLATSLDFLINKFWFRLNKGFGVNKSPRTVDMVLKAKQVLSSIISNRASVKYEEYKQKYEHNEITKEEFVALNSDLRSKLVCPEDINSDTVSEDFSAVDKWDFENALDAQRKKQAEYENAMSTIASLEGKVNEMTMASAAADDFHFKEVKEIKDKLTKSENERDSALDKLSEVQQSLSQKDEELEQYKRKDAKHNKTKKTLVCIGWVTLILAGIGVYFVGLYNSYKWANIVSGFLTIAGIVIGIVSIKVSKQRTKG